MKHTLKFTIEKETKGAVRYTEQKDALSEGVVGTLYVRKSAFKELEQIPTELTVTIEAGNG